MKLKIFQEFKEGQLNMKRLRLKKTICLRCGYPQEVPERLYNGLKDCHMCRTPEENEEREKRIGEICNWVYLKSKKK
jgi:hypothetical protein